MLMLYYIFLEANYFKLKVDGYIEFQCGFITRTYMWQILAYIYTHVYGLYMYVSAC